MSQWRKTQLPPAQAAEAPVGPRTRLPQSVHAPLCACLTPTHTAGGPAACGPGCAGSTGGRRSGRRLLGAQQHGKPLQAPCVSFWVVQLSARGWRVKRPGRDPTCLNPCVCTALFRLNCRAAAVVAAFSSTASARTSTCLLPSILRHAVQSECGRLGKTRLLLPVWALSSTSACRFMGSLRVLDSLSQYPANSSGCQHPRGGATLRILRPSPLAQVHEQRLHHGARLHYKPICNQQAGSQKPILASGMS